MKRPAILEFVNFKTIMYLTAKLYSANEYINIATKNTYIRVFLVFISYNVLFRFSAIDSLRIIFSN